MPVEPGQMLGHYRIVDKVGEGGMGVVWKAVDTRLDREVALKVLPEDVAGDAGRLGRFRREARILAGLNHPNIVTIHSVEEADGVQFLTMELVEGQTLDERIPSDGMTGADLIRYAVPIAEALRAAHARGIAHRDLKPPNIMIGPEERVKILDFGLARSAGPREVAENTGVETRTASGGVVIGTLPYMSPEQVQGRPVDARSDVFSLGIILHEMACGQRPFRGDSQAELISSLLRDDPPRVAALRGLPAELDRLLERCLQKSPGRRYASAGEILEDLKLLEDRLEAGDRVPSIAVLPFADMSPEKDQDWFCEGIAEEILNALTKVQGLHVSSRTSAFQFRDSAGDHREIGRRLGVGTFLEGSVRKAGERLRITAQLVSAADGSTLWSERYDRQMSDVFAIQDEISRAIVETLKGKLLGGERASIARARTPDLEAYNLNLRGRYFWSQRTEAGLRKGIDYFQQAIGVDPSFAPAHASLADGYTLLCSYHFLSPEDSIPKARSAARRAMELDEGLAEAHEAVGHVRFLHDAAWAEAEADYRRAVERNPGFATAHQRLALLLEVLGRTDDSRREIEIARALDPLSLIINTDVALARLIAGEPEEAIRACRSVLEMSPAFGVAHFVRGLAAEQLGDPDEAIAAFTEADRTSGATAIMTGALGHALARAGREEEAIAALKRLDDLAAAGYVSPYVRATVHLGLRRTEEALACLEQAVDQRSTWLIHLHMKLDPRLATLRDHPRFQALLERMGLAGPPG